MWRGMLEVERRWPQAEVVVFLDGDASDSPERIPELAGPILEGKADFVLGSRTLGERQIGALPIHSGWGNTFACWCIHLLTGHRFTDLGPFRAIRWSDLRNLNMVDRDFGWTVEMQIKAVRAGLTVREIPTPYRRRIGKSKISGTIVGSIRAGWKILYTIARYGLRHPRQSPDSHQLLTATRSPCE